MTEKRFTLSDRHLTEINNNIAIADGRIPCTQRQVCKLLNELHEENKELKNTIQTYKEGNELLKTTLDTVKKENNELKQFKKTTTKIEDED